MAEGFLQRHEVTKFSGHQEPRLVNSPQFDHPKKILVTGANGFIGRRVVQQLQNFSAASEIRALVLPDEKLPDGWQKLGSGDRSIGVMRGDIRDEAFVEECMAGCDGLIHLAAVVGDWAPKADFQSITVDATKSILQLAAKQGTRTTVVSSIVVYGENIAHQVCHESVEHGVACGPYSRAKQMQEVIARELQDSAGLRVAIVRPANVYGPGPSPWTLGAIEELRRGSPSIIGSGEGCAGMVYVDHVADIIARSLLVPAAEGKVFNAADGNTVTWAGYLIALAKAADCEAPGHLPKWLASSAAVIMENLWRAMRVKNRPPLTREALNLVGNDNRFPHQAAMEILGFRPWVEFDQAMSNIESWLRELD